MMTELKLAEFADRHEEILEQVGLMESWVEQLPFDEVVARKRVMTRVVEFLERYVLVEATWEEENLFPLVGATSVGLSAEHRYIARWVKELGQLAHDVDPDPALFRRAAYKLFGLLEAHMDCEERLLGPVLNASADSEARAS